ncbi:MAG: polysaccharide biosynthesis protein, partial [Methylococcales bacterium]
MKLAKKLRTPVVVFIHDLLMVPFAWFGAYWLRFNLSLIPAPYMDMAWTWLPILMVIQGAVFVYFGLYRADWRFASSPDLVRIVKAIAVGVMIFLAVVFIFSRLQGIPRSVFPIYSGLLLLSLGGARFLYRWIKDKNLLKNKGRRVLIVGAGLAGEMLVRDLFRSSNQNLLPVGFIDDKIRKLGREIHGIRVLGDAEQIPVLVEQEKIEFIFIAIPSANSNQMRRIVGYCEQANVCFRTLPRLNDMVSDRVSVDVLREVAIEDLLGRETVVLDWKKISGDINKKRVLITGAGGSIGAELCRQIAQLNPASVIVADQCEFNLYSIEKELMERFPSVPLICHLKDMSDSGAVDNLFSDTKPDIVFHAAAYKHVPMIEGQ